MMRLENIKSTGRRKKQYGRKNILADQSGQAAVEYALIAFILAVAITWALVGGLHKALQDFFDEIMAFVSLPVP
ncbi:MAG: Flp family type IVb pilin [Planctomycetota bacterium]